jgi:predicted SAM-dependent methyltransferase
MFHHSFEHLEDPDGTLREAHRLLKDNGYMLIRIPVINFAWEKYGVNWVQLDPPRHLFLYTERAFCSLAEKSGFEVEKIIYDSTAFQFWGSEQYLQNIPLNHPTSHLNNDGGTVFSQDQMDKWQSEAEVLNLRGRGDQACFYLRKAV